jgi:hypothetical protein
MARDRTKDKITVTIDPAVRTDTDADAKAAGLNRSEYVEKVLRDQHYRNLLGRAPTPEPMPAGEAVRLRELLDWQREAA